MGGACGGGSHGDTANSPAAGGHSLLGNDSLSGGGTGEFRELTFSESTTVKKSIVQCFCDSLYRSTMQIYHFPSGNAVLMVEFDNTSKAFSSSVVMHLFAADVTQDEVKKWINNQHSDGLFIEPARPIQSYVVSSENITITSSAFVESLSGFNGDEYEQYQIEFTVENLHEAAAFQLNGFSDQAEVFLQTSAPDFDR